MATNLADKRILITAGPTWVAIDSVRVISNMATGETGVMLARKLASEGAEVTLLLGESKDYRLADSINVVKFKFFDELNSLLKNCLKEESYDVIIHSAAVADYRPLTSSKKKISSSKKFRSIILKKTPKIISTLRKLSKDSLIVGFKFEPDLRKESLIKEARHLLKNAKLDLVIANSLRNNHYCAYLIDAQKESVPFSSKKSMCANLLKTIGRIYAADQCNR